MSPPLKEGELRLEPEVLWRHAGEGSGPRGLVRVVEMCGLPTCHCQDLRVLAYEIDERFESVDSGPEGCTFRHRDLGELAGVPFAENVVEVRADLQSGATFVEDPSLETLSQDQRRLLHWLQESIDRPTLDAWRKRWRAIKEDLPDEEETSPEGWREQDWRAWDESDPVMWSDIDPEEYRVCMHLDARPFVLDEVHWLEDDEEGQEVTVTFEELLPPDELEDVGRVAVHIDSLSLVQTRCSPGQHDLLLRLWAAYQARYGLDRLAEHARRFRDEIRPEIQKLARAPIRGSAKVGRNQPCPCGSGKKYKKCCGQ